MLHWRSLLFVPAMAEKFVARAHTRGAELIILDLEDSIPPVATAAADVLVPLPWPRTPETLGEPPFVAIKSRCLRIFTDAVAGA